MAKAKLKPHPYADLFPMMTGVELEALAADIGESGLLNPIVLYGGQILDGRNRLAACEKAGKEPTFSEYEGDDAGALAMVISLNVQRRDMTAAQRAIVAAKTWMASGDTSDKGKGRRVSDKNSLSIAGLAKQFKSSTATITQARDLLIEAPDLITQVESGVSLAVAYEQLQQRRKDAKQKEKDAEKVTQYRDAIDAGEMTFEEAIQKAIDDQREQESLEKSEADARNTSLKRIVDAVEWCENFIQGTPEEVFERWFQTDSPGTFNHEITQERLTTLSKEVARIAPFAPKGGRNAKRR